MEFASLAQQKGQTAIEAALEGASLRLRPILMTSLAFGAGVTPLVFAFGAGAASRQEIGVSVLGGVIFGTVLVLLIYSFNVCLGSPCVSWTNTSGRRLSLNPKHSYAANRQSEPLTQSGRKA